MKRILMGVFFVCLIVGLSSCGPNEAPDNAITECIKKGWMPIYHSTPVTTQFICNDGTMRVSLGGGNED